MSAATLDVSGLQKSVQSITEQVNALRSVAESTLATVTAGHTDSHGNGQTAATPPAPASTSPTVVPAPQGPNLLMNASFESAEGYKPGSWDLLKNGSVGAWQSSNDRIEVWNNGFNGITATDGKNVAEVDNYNGVLSQAVKTEAGKVYDLSFDFAGRPGYIASSKMEVVWNGVVIATVTPDSSTMKHYEFKATGTGGNDVLAFRSVDGDTDSYGGLIDKVGLYASSQQVDPDPVDPVISTNGTDGDDHFTGGAGKDVFYVKKGNDIIDGGSGDYNQVDLDGGASDWTFTKNANGSITAVNATYGTKTLTQIDGVFFYGSGKWAPMSELLAAAPGGAGGATPPAAGQGQNLLMNASFETAEGYKPGSWDLLKNGSVGAWQSSNDRIEVWNDGFNGITATDGKNVAEVDNNNGVLSQAVKTEAGKVYDLSFDFAGRPGYIASSKMEVVWNGVVIATVTPDSSTMKHYEFKATGTGGNDVLAFRSVDGDTDSYGGLIDKVGLYASSQPADPATGSVNTIIANPAGGGTFGTDGNDHFVGGAGNDVFNAEKGNDIIDGGGGDYNQVDLNGAASDWTFTTNSNGSITAVNATYGTKTLTEIDGVYFCGSGKWSPMSDLVKKAAATQDGAAANASGGNTTGLGMDVQHTDATHTDVAPVKAGAVHDDAGNHGQVDLSKSIATTDFSGHSAGSASGAMGHDTHADIGGMWGQDDNQCQSDAPHIA